MTLIRGSLGATIALCLASLLVLVAAAGRPAPAPFHNPAPDGGAAAAGAPSLGAVAGSVVPPQLPGFQALHRLTAEEPIIPAEYNVYANTVSGFVDPTLSSIRPLVYVPNSNAATVDLIDPATMALVGHFGVGAIPHHVTPSWDLKHLYVDDEAASMLTVIDPATATVTGTISVPYPYNLYFTPDGKKAIVVVERLARLDFRDPNTWQLIKSVPIPYRGVDHLDFSADGSYLLASTEWSGILVKVDTRTMAITGYLNVGGLPIDVRLAPAGDVFYVANQGYRAGVSVVNGNTMQEVGFIPTGRGAHGLQVSRNTQFMYVSNRDAGTISVIDLLRRSVVATWKVGGSPDMFQLSPDGKRLWVSSRYNATVLVIDSDSGHVLSSIRAGAGDHGLTYFPNTGRYSTGHNGVYR